MSYQNSITGTISITVLPQENGSYLCRIEPIFNDGSRTAQVFYGQTLEHVIASVFRQLLNGDSHNITEQSIPTKEPKESKATTKKKNTLVPELIKSPIDKSPR